MKIISWSLALGGLIFLLIEAVDLHRSTICRQEAWLKSTELKTRSLLSHPSQHLYQTDQHQGLRIFKLGNKIFWQRKESKKIHLFDLELKGKL